MKRLDKLWVYAVRNTTPSEYFKILAIMIYCVKAGNNRANECEIFEQLLSQKGGR